MIPVLTPTPVAVLEPNGTEGHRRRRRRTGWIIAAVLILDVAVCLPFLVDPLELLGAPAAPAGIVRKEYLIFLSGPEALPALESYTTAHPEVRLEHRGNVLSTAVVSVPGRRETLIEGLKAQPFVALLAPGGRGLCQ